MQNNQDDCINITTDTAVESTRNRLEDPKERGAVTTQTHGSIFNLTTLISSAIRLAKMNEEFYYLLIFLVLWLALCMFEFLYGFLESKVDILSDAFFIYFKTFSFLITGFSILLSKVYVFPNSFLKNRIELLSALSNLVFLVIVSLHMCIQALHLITEIHEHEEQEDTDTVSFLSNFFMIKIVLNVVILLKFSDYLIHPSVQIKMMIWKKYRTWRSVFDIHTFNDAKPVIKQWNNHFENMNALMINILCDMCSSIVFIILLYLSSNKHFEFIFSIVCLINIVIVALTVLPTFSSILLILMQGKSEIYQPFKDKLDKEITMFEGCTGIENLKIWQISHCEIKCKNILNLRLFEALWNCRAR
jgi:Co/Zn/Cd efflux system component